MLELLDTHTTAVVARDTATRQRVLMCSPHTMRYVVPDDLVHNAQCVLQHTRPVVRAVFSPDGDKVATLALAPGAFMPEVAVVFNGGGVVWLLPGEGPRTATTSGAHVVSGSADNNYDDIRGPGTTLDLVWSPSSSALMVRTPHCIWLLNLPVPGKLHTAPLPSYMRVMWACARRPGDDADVVAALWDDTHPLGTFAAPHAVDLWQRGFGLASDRLASWVTADDAPISNKEYARTAAAATSDPPSKQRVLRSVTRIVCTDTHAAVLVQPPVVSSTFVPYVVNILANPGPKCKEAGHHCAAGSVLSHLCFFTCKDPVEAIAMRGNFIATLQKDHVAGSYKCTLCAITTTTVAKAKARRLHVHVVCVQPPTTPLVNFGFLSDNVVAITFVSCAVRVVF